MNSCPLSWWKQNESDYPNISRAAKRYLSIQASSATIERLFSQLSFIQSGRRNRIQLETLSAIAFLRVNSNSWGSTVNNSNEYDFPKTIDKIKMKTTDDICIMLDNLTLEQDEELNEELDIIEDENLDEENEQILLNEIL